MKEFDLRVNNGGRRANAGRIKLYPTSETTTFRIDAENLKKFKEKWGKMTNQRINQLIKNDIF